MVGDDEHAKAEGGVRVWKSTDVQPCGELLELMEQEGDTRGMGGWSDE